MNAVADVLVSTAVIVAIVALVFLLLRSEERFEAERQRWESERGRLMAAAILAKDERTAGVAASVVKASGDPEPTKPKAPSLPIGL